MSPDTLQDALWTLSGPVWWTGYAIVSAIGAIALFISLVRDFDNLDALSASRLLILSGMIIGAFVKFNSACQFISPAFLLTGTTFAAFLIATNWCHLHGTFRQRIWRVWCALWHRPQSQERNLND